MFNLPPVTLVTISGALLFGMVLALLGSLKLTLAKRLELGEARIGVLLSAFNLALIPMMLLMGILIDKYSVRGVLIGGSVVTSLSLFCLCLPLSYVRTVGAALLLGVGSAAVSTASMVLMPQAFGEYSHNNEANAVNLGCVFIAFGALVTPVLVDLLILALDFRKAVSILAILSLVPAVFAGLTPSAVFAFHDRHAEVSQLLHEPSLWLACLVCLFYVPLESVISAWITTYLTEMGSGERRAAWMHSAFWACFLASRLLIAVMNLPSFWTPGLFLVVPSLLTAVLLGNLSGTASPASARSGLLLLGLTLGPIFPTLVGLVFRQFSESRGTAYGAVFAIGSLGSLVFAPMIGARANQITIQRAMRIPMIIALALTAAALVFSVTL